MKGTGGLRSDQIQMGDGDGALKAESPIWSRIFPLHVHSHYAQVGNEITDLEEVTNCRMSCVIGTSDIQIHTKA
jgi:hypothetical protein